MFQNKEALYRHESKLVSTSILFAERLWHDVYFASHERVVGALTTIRPIRWLVEVIYLIIDRLSELRYNPRHVISTAGLK